MLEGAIKLFTIRGIEIRLDYSWFVIFALVTYSLAAEQFPAEWPLAIRVALGVVTSLAFFFSVLLHELSHSFVAQAHGIQVPRITLFIFGGAAQIAEEPKSAWDEFLMAMAGPAMSVVLSLVFGALYYLADRIGMVPFSILFQWLAIINLTLAIFNLIPGFPLDGGRVLRAILWGASRDLNRSTRIAASVGQVVGGVFILGGGAMALAKPGNLINGLWMAFIGWFLLRAARQSGQRQAALAALEPHWAGEVMSTDCAFVDPRTPLSDLFNFHVLRAGKRCFPVIEDGRVVGVISLTRIRQVPAERWMTTTAREIMTPAETMKIIGPQTRLAEVLELMAREGADFIPVIDNGAFRGVVFRESVLELLRVKGAI